MYVGCFEHVCYHQAEASILRVTVELWTVALAEPNEAEFGRL